MNKASWPGFQSIWWGICYPKLDPESVERTELGLGGRRSESSEGIQPRMLGRGQQEVQRPSQLLCPSTVICVGGLLRDTHGQEQTAKTNSQLTDVCSPRIRKACLLCWGLCVPGTTASRAES